VARERRRGGAAAAEGWRGPVRFSRSSTRSTSRSDTSTVPSSTSTVVVCAEVATVNQVPCTLTTWPGRDDVERLARLVRADADRDLALRQLEPLGARLERASVSSASPKSRNPRALGPLRGGAAGAGGGQAVPGADAGVEAEAARSSRPGRAARRPPMSVTSASRRSGWTSGVVAPRHRPGLGRVRRRRAHPRQHPGGHRGREAEADEERRGAPSPTVAGVVQRMLASARASAAGERSGGAHARRVRRARCGRSRCARAPSRRRRSRRRGAARGATTCRPCGGADVAHARSPSVAGAGARSRVRASLAARA